MAKRVLLGALLSAATMTNPCITLAQTAGQTGSSGTFGIAEIVVTASKRSEDLQKTPAALSVVDGRALAIAGLTDPTQLSKVVPSLVIGKQGSNAVVFLRGVGQTNSSVQAQPGISTNIDGVYLPRELAAGALFDLERVEVLPGPQGTLYGRNAVGGAINFVTRKPGTEFGGEGFVEIGNYSAIHLFNAVDIPIGDTLAVRGALDMNRHDGYLSNGGNDADSLAGRIGISFRPSSIFAATIQYTHTREGGRGLQNIARGTDNPPFGSKNDPYFDSFPMDGVAGLHSRGNILTANFTVHLNDDLNLSYLPGYLQTKFTDGSQFNGVVYGFFTQAVNQYSQELRLSNNGEGPLKWMTGLFWFHERPKLAADVGLPAFAFVRLRNRLKSYAGFGEATYSINDRFRLTAGGRYSVDSFDGDATQTPPLALSAAKDTQHRFDWKFGAEFDLAPRSMLYATAQSGYLQGGFTQVELTSTLPKTFKPETLIAITAGSKNRFLDNRLQINNEVFYYSYKNYQLQTIPYDESTHQTTFLILNVPKADIYGDQLDIVYSLDQNTDLTASAAYLSAKITHGLNAVPSYQGFQLPDAPEFTINATIEHRFPLSNGGHITARVATTFNSGYWTVFTHDSFSHQDSFTKTDLNLTYYDPKDHWYFGGYVRNLEKAVVYYGSNAGPFPGSFSPTFIDAPRTFGVRAGYNF